MSWIFAAVAFWAVSTQIGIARKFFGSMGNWQYLGRHWLYAAVAFGLVLPAVIGDPTRGLPRKVLHVRAGLGWG